VYVFVCVCACACVRVCVFACLRVCVCVCACGHCCCFGGTLPLVLLSNPHAPLRFFAALCRMCGTSATGCVMVPAPAQLVTPILSLPVVDRRRGRAAAAAGTPAPSCQVLQAPPSIPGAPPPRFVAMASPPRAGLQGGGASGAYLGLALTSGVVVVDGNAPAASPLLQWQLPRGVSEPLLWRSDGAGGHLMVVRVCRSMWLWSVVSWPC
jgi:hypothetical protein